MKRSLRIALTAPALGLLAALPLAGTASASSATAQASLRPVNDADASGRATVEVQGNKLTVYLAARGLVADQPHAAHIHFGADARHECPTFERDDTSPRDGRLSTTEGAPAYGPIVVSLTKTGDTSPASGLAVDRFDTAPGGRIQYERGSIKVSHSVARAIETGQAVVVVHGVDYDHDGAYDGATPSDLDPALPAEATDPAVCGVLRVASSRGVH
jgi:hypothetical protein